MRCRRQKQRPFVHGGTAMGAATADDMRNGKKQRKQQRRLSIDQRAGKRDHTGGWGRWRRTGPAPGSWIDCIRRARRWGGRATAVQVSSGGQTTRATRQLRTFGMRGGTAALVGLFFFDFAAWRIAVRIQAARLVTGGDGDPHPVSEWRRAGRGHAVRRRLKTRTDTERRCHSSQPQ